jgi:hypothetical protein
LPIHASCSPSSPRWPARRCSAGRKKNTAIASSAASARARTAQGGLNLSIALPGCEFECLLPDAYYSGMPRCRRTNPSAHRPNGHSLSFRHTCAAPQELRAVVAGFGERRIDEYRVGFTRRASNDVIYGVVWLPTVARTATSTDNATLEGEAPIEGPLEEIVSLLKECGVTDVRRHAGRFEPEHCDDCGVPLYADPLGEIVHAEMPEDALPPSRTFTEPRRGPPAWKLPWFRRSGFFAPARLPVQISDFLSFQPSRHRVRSLSPSDRRHADGGSTTHLMEVGYAVPGAEPDAERRDGLKVLLRQIDRHATINDAPDGFQARRLLRTERFDLVAINWPDVGRHGELQALCSACATPVAVMVDESTPAAIQRFYDYGVAGGSHATRPHLIVRALEIVLLGGHIPPSR